MKDEIIKRLMAKAPEPIYLLDGDNEAWTRACQAFAKALAQDAKLAFGYQPSPHTEGGDRFKLHEIKRAIDTHTCIMLDLQPLNEVVTAAEIIKALRGETFGCDKLADRIEKFGIRGIT